ncbi:MAG: nickel-responsive transcriptional regulator NikR [Planctomycetota bacterium]|jgi:CopG family nickel-responsive transcriptional regulator
MAQIERVGVSLDKKLLTDFDKLIAEQGYQNRSEAIRDLIRREISSRQLNNPNTNAIGAVFIVYDHHATQLMEKLTAMQHSQLLETISSMHIHLDKHECLEIIVLKGQAGKIQKMAETLLSLKGVKLGKINLLAT